MTLIPPGAYAYFECGDFLSKCRILALPIVAINWREIMQAGSTLWRMSPPKEAQNIPTQGVENGDIHE
jgi:hypothetical protein